MCGGDIFLKAQCKTVNKLNDEQMSFSAITKFAKIINLNERIRVPN